MADKLQHKKKFLIGIDEAGRGPLAGPVAVGAVMIRQPASMSARRILAVARDSKQISEKEREGVFDLMREAEKSGDISFAVSFCAARVIDTKGIVFAINYALKNNLKKLGALPRNVNIMLDGSLKAPAHFKNQKTIIKGDSLVPIIGLASIAAKVLRDRHMKKLSKKYPEYGFEIHKGYGTKAHQRAIKKYGLSIEHRASWCC